MDCLGRPLKSSGPENHSMRKLKRHDLVEQDFDEVSLKKIDEIKQVLNAETIFCGDITELGAMNMIEEDGKQVASGNMASIQAVKIRGQWFARKTIWISVQDNREMYEKEIQCLQKLRKAAHWHIVQLIGCYINPSNEGHIILSPLAECDLASFLAEPLTTGRQRVMQRWFGCLAAALKNIHDHDLKHKDIKPENILVHGDNIIITDFGISNQFCGRSSSRGRCLGALVYIAPEVFKEDRRGRSQDVWALICCFIEMVSVMQGFVVDEFRKWCIPEAWRFNFHADHGRVVLWLEHRLDRTKSDGQLALLHLLLKGFKINQDERPTATDLLNQLQGMPSFVGECCAAPISRCGPPGGKSFPSLSAKSPRGPAPGSLSEFVITAREEITKQLQAPSIKHSLDELLNEVERQEVRSLRSAEKKLLLYIAPVCSSKSRSSGFQVS